MVTSRRAVVVALATILTVTLAAPAGAGQLIKYRGETSQGQRIILKVLKRDSGRRFLSWFYIGVVGTCEDATTQEFGFIPLARPGPRLGPDGEFRLRDPSARGLGHFQYRGQGTVGFRNAAGTFDLAYVDRFEDGSGSQPCSTGEIEWSAERRRATPARPESAA